VIYRNNRWQEPFVITTNNDIDKFTEKYAYKFRTMMGGFGSAGKMFRISGIPAENGYRVLNLTDFIYNTRTNQLQRMPFSDFIRYGSWSDYDNDGAMITDWINSSNDDYVNLEFIFDPGGQVTNEDVFVCGSFNNWNPDASWQMWYDEQKRYYTLQHWVRRARHDYMYAIGKYNVTTHKVEHLAYDFYEGNTGTSGHTFIGFIYYREFEYGGYDSIIGVGASNANAGRW
jgi:hypothetical protein